MDIWAWTYTKRQELIDAGHHRLAYLMDDLPSYVCSDDHQRVDAIYPEALALARSLGDSWCELFIRHWYLQSQVLNRNNSKGMLEEAIDLLDFSHQPENKDCPQRVCTVQDLANCYGISDNLGYANERIQVSLETLNSINGSWPCYECVAGELVDALVDKGDAEEVQKHLTIIKQELNKHNKTLSGDLSLSFIDALIHQGKYAEAKQQAAKARCDGGGERFEKNKDIILAKCHCLLEEWEAAINVCPAFDSIVDTPAYFDDWSEVQFLLMQNEELEFTQATVHQFNKIAHVNANNGAIRYSISILKRLAELSITKKYFFAAQNAIEKISLLIPQLAQDLGASQIERELTLLLHQNTAAAEGLSFDSMEQITQNEFAHADQEAWTLVNLQENFHDDIKFNLRLAELYQYYFREDKAELILKQAYDKHPQVQRIEYHYGRWVLQNKGIKAFQQLFPLAPTCLTSPNEDQWSRLWLHIEACEHSNPEQALTYSEVLINIDPDSKAALYEAFKLSKRSRLYEKAMEYINKLIALQPDDNNLVWDKLIVASIDEEWSVVTECAKQLELNIDETLPINEQDFGKIRVQIEDEHGNHYNLLTRRTGPVTGRVIGVNDLHDPVYYNDVVVFDPAALNKLDQQDEDGYRCDGEGFYTWLYPCEHITHKHHYQIIPVDGVHPGEDALDSLIALLEHEKIHVIIRSNEDYEIYLEQDSTSESTEEQNEYSSALGIYMFLLVSDETDLAHLAQILSNFSGHQAHPLTWLTLAELLGDSDMIAQQQALVDKYELY